MEESKPPCLYCLCTLFHSFLDKRESSGLEGLVRPVGAVAAGVAGARSTLAATASVLAPAAPWEQWLQVLLVPDLHWPPQLRAGPSWPLGAVAAGVAGARSTLAATTSVLAPGGSGCRCCWCQVYTGRHDIRAGPSWPLGAVAGGVAGARSTLVATTSVLAPGSSGCRHSRRRFRNHCDSFVPSVRDKVGVGFC
eukprot:gene12399-15590_t